MDYKDKKIKDNINNNDNHEKKVNRNEIKDIQDKDNNIDSKNIKEEIKKNKKSNSFYNTDEILNLENKEIILSQRLKEIQSYIVKIKSDKNYINISNENNLYYKKNRDKVKFKDKKNNLTKVHYYNSTSNMKKDKKEGKRNSFFLRSESNKEKKINNFLKFSNKSDKKPKTKVFDRLFEDGIRNNKSKQNSKLSKDYFSTVKINKKYNNSEWNEIYKKRFKSYQDNIYKKREEIKKFKENEIKRKEDEIINLYKCKKAPIKHIIEVSQRMYDEAKKRKLIIEEKKMNSKNKNNVDDSFYKYVKFINCEPYIFDVNNSIKCNNNKFIIKKEKNSNINLNKKNGKNNTKMPISELNNKRFEKCLKLYKIQDNKYIQNNRYIFNNNYININDRKLNDNIIYVDGCSYNLDEERKILIQMAEHKNLYQRNSNENKLKNERIDSCINGYNLESDKLIFEFFMRQLD